MRAEISRESPSPHFQLYFERHLRLVDRVSLLEYLVFRVPPRFYCSLAVRNAGEHHLSVPAGFTFIDHRVRRHGMDHNYSIPDRRSTAIGDDGKLNRRAL